MNAPVRIDDLERCRPWIEAALAKNDNLNTWEEVLGGIASGHMQFWPKPKGCIITQVVIYHDKKALHVFLAGGELDAITDMTEELVEWAKRQGCSFATFDGRMGWKKPLEKLGWKEKSITMQMEF